METCSVGGGWHGMQIYVTGDFPQLRWATAFQQLWPTALSAIFLNRADYELSYDTTQARCRAHNGIFAGLETSAAAPVAQICPL